MSSWTEILKRDFQVITSHNYDNGEISAEYKVKNNPLRIQGSYPCKEMEGILETDVSTTPRYIQRKEPSRCMEFELWGVQYIEHLFDCTSTPLHNLFIECDSGEEWYFLFRDELWDLFELEVEEKHCDDRKGMKE